MRGLCPIVLENLEEFTTTTPPSPSGRDSRCPEATERPMHGRRKEPARGDRVSEWGEPHAAFAAGALKRALADDGPEIVGFSGTSGGAVCALLAWYGLRSEGRGRAVELLKAFWQDNTVRGLYEFSG